MEKVDLDEYHWHEALDRSHICAEFVTDWLLKHPAIHQTEHLRLKVLDVINLLQEVYQDVGNADVSSV